MRHPRWRALVALTAVIVLVAAACGDDDDAAEPDAEPVAEPEEIPDGPTIRIRAQDFSESVTINETYAQYLEALGYPVAIDDPLGFRDAFIEALQADEIDMTVDYIGGSLAQLAGEDIDIDQSDPDQVLEAIRSLYGEFDVEVLDYSPAIDGDAVVVRGETAEEFGLETLSDLAEVAPELTLGASEQCFTRPQCLPGMEAVYGISFGDERPIEFGSALGEALSAGEIDVTVWNDTAPQIVVEGFVVLEDDQGLFPAQNIAPVVRSEIVEAYGSDFVDALNDLSARITTEDLLDWNEQTDIEFEAPASVARAWLEDQGLV